MSQRKETGRAGDTIQQLKLIAENGQGLFTISRELGTSVFTCTIAITA